MSAPRSYDLSWMPLHVGDWLGSLTVARLSLAGEGAFLRLLLHQWRSEGGGLPADPAELKLLTRWSGRGWEATWARIAVHFPLSAEDGQRRNPRLTKERDAVLRTRDGQSRGGRNKREKGSRTDGTSDKVVMHANIETPVKAVPQVVINQQQKASQLEVNINNPKPQTTASDEAVSATASTGQAKSTADTTAAEGMADQFEEPAHRDAYLVFRRAHPRPHSYDGTLGMMLHGGHGPGGRRVTIWQLGSALADAAGDEKVVTFNPNWFRGFLANAPQERPVVAVPARYELPGAIRDPDTGAVVWYTGMPEYLKPGYVEPTEEEAAP